MSGTALADSAVSAASGGSERRRPRCPALIQTRGLLRGNTNGLCQRIDEEISLFHEALQNEATLKRLKRIARLAA